MTHSTEFHERAGTLDADDELAELRSRFDVPDDTIYLDGNSLGLMGSTVPDRVADVVRREWATDAIRSWTDAGWFDMPITVGNRIAPLVGARPGEVAVGDSTSVNLFKCLAAGLHLRPDRRVILAEGDNFPTDGYMATGLADLVPDVEVRWLESHEVLAEAVTADVAVVLLSHVDYRTSAKRDMASQTQAIHESGALVLWDLSHSTGAVELDLPGAGVDMAVGCTYKYLNGGPGAPAFVWADPKLAAEARQPLSGWMGHSDPFGFTRAFNPAEGARRFVSGTPQILSLAALDEALEVWDDIDRAALYAKGSAMTDLFIDAVESLCAGHGLRLNSPRDAASRGSHVSFELDEGGYEVVQALKERGVVGDFRAPTTLRFGFAPLYLTFTEVIDAAGHLAEILESGEWKQDRFSVRSTVT